MNTDPMLRKGEVWKHKRLDKLARINTVDRLDGDIQVIDDQKNKIRWLSIKGFLRDYAPTRDTPTPRPTKAGQKVRTEGGNLATTTDFPDRNGLIPISFNEGKHPLIQSIYALTLVETHNGH